MLRMFEKELRVAMTLTGVASVAKVDGAILFR
jgi:isopentenyl diphosphate isomerase/L-lactate dehydrogenase-like FMN-dependent dehydrogenase